MNSPNSKTPGKGREACPTGMLVDLTDAEQTPYPQQLLRVAEFDDTFGIFQANPSNILKPVTTSTNHTDAKLIDDHLPIDLENKALEKIKGNNRRSLSSPTGRLKGKSPPNDPFSPKFSTGRSSCTSSASNSPADPFSPRFFAKKEGGRRGEVTESLEDQKNPSPQDPFSPQVLSQFSSNKNKRSSTGRKSTGSESDCSILDVDNLSTFSISESDILEQFVNKIEEQPEKNNETEQLQKPKTPPIHNGDGDYVPVEIGGSQLRQATPSMYNNPTDKRRRDSVNAQLQRLSLLLSNPPSPPSPEENAIKNKGNYFPAPTTPQVRTNQSNFSEWTTPRSSVSTFTSPKRVFTETIATATRMPPSPMSSCNKYFPSSAVNTATAPRAPIFIAQPLLSPEVDINDIHEETEEDGKLSKRLSFGSTTSEPASPDEIRQVKVPKPVATIRGAPQQQRMQPPQPPQRQQAKPLKAIAPMPLTTTAPRDKCPSAPVTRKFTPQNPVGSASPCGRNLSQLTPGRKSYNAVRSSGYGQPAGTSTPKKVSLESPMRRTSIPPSPGLNRGGTPSRLSFSISQSTTGNQLQNKSSLNRQHSFQYRKNNEQQKSAAVGVGSSVIPSVGNKENVSAKVGVLPRFGFAYKK